MNKKNKIDKIENSEQKSLRRKFLKKAVYSAPGLVMLGQLTKPTNANANECGTSDNPCGPGGPIGGGR